MTVAVPAADETIRAAANRRLDTLTKPLGALGRLEALAAQICAIQRTLSPTISRPVAVHRALLAHLKAEPLLDLGMRLGEGSGAANALSVARAAVSLFAEMAIFEGAGVSEKIACTGRSPCS